MALRNRLLGRGDPPVPGDVYGGYRLLEKVAEGRLSALFRGEHVKSGEVVAVKILSDYGCDVADKLTRKLKKEWEGQRARRLKHRNVVRTLTCGKHHGRYYLVMEFLPGGNLADLLHTRARVLRGKKIEIMQQAARGLAYIHSEGIIHRDVCPRNVMLSAYGVAKIIDFGVAADKGDRIRDTGMRTGRPAYMAPELIRTNRFNERTDIYAFGVSLYEVTTGRRCVRGSQSTFAALAAALKTDIPEPSSVRPSISPRLERAIMKALEADPRRRYATTDSLLEDLEPLTEEDL
ncbi:MAG: serine/threonine-protein kinase [Candidatus Brocadiia bacterium]